jgi:tetratricopeptide (TPR) repeat protein
MKNVVAIPVISMVLSAASSCSKDFLKENPRTDLVVPSTYKEMRALLDDDFSMNLTPAMGEISADNYYLSATYWQTLLQNHERNCYIWKPDIYEGQPNVNDWSLSYTQVLHANVVLEALAALEEKGSLDAEGKNLKGMALFFRAHAFYNIAQQFAPPYNSQTAQSELGIPLRTSSDISKKFPRASVEATYNQILNDLSAAEDLVSPNVEYSYKNRPSKPATYGLKARVYLSMHNYPKALEYSDLALQLYDSLLNFNDLDTLILNPIKRENSEVIFQSHLVDNNILSAVAFSDVIIDSGLYKSYKEGDLRRSIFYFKGFTGNINLKASFSGNFFPFSGIATGELLLIKAECLARAGYSEEALDQLNKLLITRFKPSQFVPHSASSPEEALNIILEERRKELAFRGLRWTDLRRLNQEGYNITLQRLIDGDIFTLTPNSKLYVLPIPPDVLAQSGIPDNIRQ